MFENELPDLLQTLGPADPVPWTVDKDYWLTRVLRRLDTEVRGEFLFKGGTSLSMGYSLIDRFSEDIDLLVTSDTPEAAIDDIVSLIEDELGESADTAREGPAYKFVVFPFRAAEPAPARLKNMRSIRVDIGAQGGSHPSETREIAPIARRLVEHRGLEADEDDLQPFTVDILHPARTCLEKLEAVNVAALDLHMGRRDGLTSRDGKHPYDVYRILGHQPSIEMLSDSSQRMAMIEAIDEANQKWFGGPSRRPERGYAFSPAFIDAQLASEFQEACEKAMRNYLWKGAYTPIWEEIIDRISASKHLL